MMPISTSSGILTVTDLNDFKGPAQTTNLGVRSSSLFGRHQINELAIECTSLLPDALRKAAGRNFTCEICGKKVGDRRWKVRPKPGHPMHLIGCAAKRQDTHAVSSKIKRQSCPSTMISASA
jgi:hypothetical protein